MRRMLWSRVGMGGRRRLYSEMVSAAELGKEVLWLVPEPYSHACERILAEIGGPGICMKAETATFARLCDRILTLEGGRAMPSLDAGGRLLTLRRAVRQIAERLSEFAGVFARPDQLRALASTMDVCKCYGITPALLEKAAENAEDSAKTRLRELSLIFGAYDALCAQSTMDSRDRTLIAAERLKSGGFGKGLALFISHFVSFTPQERLLLAALTARTSEVTLFFEGEPDPVSFPALCRTASQCQKEWGRFQVETISEPEEDIAEGLRYWEQRWFDSGAAPFSGDGSVELYRAAGPAEECRFAAERIVRLVSEEGLRYRDIALLCADGETYGPLASAIFPHYQIPLFQDKMEGMAAKPLCRLIEAAGSCIRYGFRPDDVMRLLRTRLTSVSQESADLLEMYLRRWNLYGSRFTGKQDWTRPPGGYGRSGEEAAALLTELNHTRRFLSGSLRPLTAGRTARDCAERLLSVLTALSVPENIQLRQWELSRQGELRAAAECAQMWDLYCAAAEQCALILGDEPLGMEEYIQLLLLVLNEYSVGAIPASLDRVHCGDIGRFARIPVKAVIILGASFDALPSRSGPGGLLTLSELSALEAAGCEIPPDPCERMEREFYNLYTACTLPRQKLIVTYPLSRQGDDLPARFVSDAARIFSEPIQTVTPPRYPFSNKVRPPSRAPLGGENPQLLYGKTLSLTASRLEKWSGCRFAYFCRYGLRLEEPVQSGFQPSDIGTFTHEILRELVQQVMQEGGFHKVSADWMRDCAAKLSNARARMMFRPPEGERIRLWRQGERLTRSMERLAETLYEEMSHSEFVPFGFEEQLWGEPIPLAQPIGGVESYIFFGSADRIDRCIIDGVPYLRVIDYKSKKTLSFSDMLAGKSLQMPLYLFQVCVPNPEHPEQKRPVPAGVMYVPTIEPLLRTDGPVSEETAKALLRKELRRSGLYLSDPAVLKAMDGHSDPKESLLGLFEEKRSGPPTATAEQMALLERFVEARSLEMVQSLAGGDISANPLTEGNGDSECQYCAYRAACHFDPLHDEGRYKQKAAAPESFFQALSAVFAEKEGEE